MKGDELLGNSIERPLRQFSSFFQGSTEFQCVNTCYPTLPSQPVLMLEMCNKICPFNPSASKICLQCPEILNIVKIPPPDNSVSPRDHPEEIYIHPVTHVIVFTPEILFVNTYEKKCCYLDRCDVVPIDFNCDPICYEPCDSPCTGQCQLNPQCPKRCEEIHQQQLRIEYKIWLMQKINEIKLKYKKMAEACILRTQIAMESDIATFYEKAETYVGVPEVILETLPPQSQQFAVSDGHGQHQFNKVGNLIIGDE